MLCPFGEITGNYFCACATASVTVATPPIHRDNGGITQSTRILPLPSSPLTSRYRSKYPIPYEQRRVNHSL